MYIPNLSSILLKSRIQIYFWRKHLQESTLLKSILKYINEFMFQTCFENLEGGVLTLNIRLRISWSSLRCHEARSLHIVNCTSVTKDHFRSHTGPWHHTSERGRERHTWGGLKMCHSGEKLVLPHLRTPNAGLLCQLFVGGTGWQQLRAHLLGGLNGHVYKHTHI